VFAPALLSKYVSTVHCKEIKVSVKDMGALLLMPERSWQAVTLMVTFISYTTNKGA
jgi:hypothetical protein